MKYWEILLSKQRERGRDGLTLPFLIGAQNYLPETFDRQNIQDLIYEMTIGNTFVTCVRFCTGTQTLIFEIRKVRNAVYFPKFNDQEQNGLSVGTFHREQLGNDVNILIEEMLEQFQEPIDKKLFSAEPNVNERKVNWRPFNDYDDIPFIKECFQLLAHNYR